jgi:hypothetical protein
MTQPPFSPPAPSRRSVLIVAAGAVVGALLMLGITATRTDHLPEVPPGPEVTVAVTP